MWGDGGAYAAWARYLDAWRSGLGEPNAALPVIDDKDLSPETWVRLTNRIVDALDARLGLWSSALTADLAKSTSEFGAGRALSQGRIGLTSMFRLCEHPGLPTDLRRQLRELIEQQVRSIQSTLEESLRRQEAAGAPRTAIEARRRTIRDNPLTTVLGNVGPPTPDGRRPADPWTFDPGGPSRRRLIVD